MMVCAESVDAAMLRDEDEDEDDREPITSAEVREGARGGLLMLRWLGGSWIL